jgi:hypothetical protein
MKSKINKLSFVESFSLYQEKLNFNIFLIYLLKQLELLILKL